MRRASEQDSSRSAKKRRKSAQPELFDITTVDRPRGDEQFYRDRFLAWRRINHRDDPSQSLADKTNSWRTFVRLENEGKIDSLLEKVSRSRRSSESLRTSDRRSSDRPESTGGSRTRERHLEHQPQGSHDAPRCLRSGDTRASERGRSDSFASSGGSTVSDHPDGPRSTPPATDDLHESRSSEVGLNAKTIERLWKWKSAHRIQIAELSQHCSDLTTRCESLEARCGAFEDRLDEDAGSLLGNLRGDFEARLVALESVKEQSFDVLQRLYAESQLQTAELARLRDQVDALQHDFERLRRIQ